MLTFVVDLLLALPEVGALVIFTLGIVIVFQASKVLNLSHGAMAMVPAYITYQLSVLRLPLPVAVLGGVLAGAAIGFGVEFAVVRRLRGRGATAQTVGTVAVFGLGIAVAAKVWGTNPKQEPALFPSGGIPVGHSELSYVDLGLFATGLACAALLYLLFRFTALGLAMRGVADNRRAASLMGVNPDRTTSIAWALAGVLAGLSGILLATSTSLHPYSLSLAVLPAFVAALLGGLDRIWAAVGGAAIVGLVLGAVPGLATVPVVGSFAAAQGTAQVVLTILALAIMASRGKSLVGSDVRGDAI
ncbi:MAG: branched-chain amino acid ABC transporter permease [Candidatus Dormibacteria bacterium]